MYISAFPVTFPKCLFDSYTGTWFEFKIHCKMAEMVVEKRPLISSLEFRDSKNARNSQKKYSWLLFKRIYSDSNIQHLTFSF